MGGMTFPGMDKFYSKQARRMKLLNDSSKYSNAFGKAGGFYGMTSLENIFNPYAPSNNFFEGGSEGMNQSAVGGLSRYGGDIVSQFNPMIGAGLQGFGDVADMFGYNPKVEGINNKYNPFEKPVFDLGDESKAVNEYWDKLKDQTNKKTLSATAGGAALGTAIAPGIGTAIGAGVGAIAGLFGRRQARKKGEWAANKARNELGLALGRFNKANQSYYDSANASDKSNAIRQYNSFGIPRYNSNIY